MSCLVFISFGGRFRALLKVLDYRAVGGGEYGKAFQWALWAGNHACHRVYTCKVTLLANSREAGCNTPFVLSGWGEGVKDTTSSLEHIKMSDSRKGLHRLIPKEDKFSKQIFRGL